MRIRSIAELCQCRKSRINPVTSNHKEVAARNQIASRAASCLLLSRRHQLDKNLFKLQLCEAQATTRVRHLVQDRTAPLIITSQVNLKRASPSWSIWKQVTVNRRVIHSNTSKAKTWSYTTWKSSWNQALKERSKKVSSRFARSLEVKSQLKAKKSKCM